MHAAARTIAKDYQGVFPSDYEQIRSLKGVGEYTAAAISSFAFGLPTPVLDSNVIRILCRIEGIYDDPAKRGTRIRLYSLLDKMINTADPGQFNQAIMNFGAIQCKARKPDCGSCVLARHCVAFREGLVDILPVRIRKRKRKERFFHYFRIQNNTGLVLHQRTAKDIWQQMYELPMIETASSGIPPRPLRERFLPQFGITSPVTVRRLQRISQTLTHQEIHCTFYDVEVRRISRQRLVGNTRFAEFKNLNTFALPKVIRSFISDNSLHLSKYDQQSNSRRTFGSRSRSTTS
jgi:A/G-specific adenine glycosylase